MGVGVDVCVDVCVCYNRTDELFHWSRIQEEFVVRCCYTLIPLLTPSLPLPHPLPLQGASTPKPQATHGLSTTNMPTSSPVLQPVPGGICPSLPGPNRVGLSSINRTEASRSASHSMPRVCRWMVLAEIACDRKRRYKCLWCKLIVI